jgi:hypothetical protein
MDDQDIDPGLLGALNATVQPASTGDSGVDPGLLKQLNSGSAPAEKPHVVPVVTHAPTTQYQKSVAPTSAPEMSWGDVANSAVKNALPSAAGVLGGVAHAVMHPVQTGSALVDLGKGAISQAGLGNQDPAQKAKTEALIGALENHYKTAYGSVKGFKNAVATDPASVALDVSAPLTLGGGALADAGGVTGRVAGMAAKVGSYVDPVQLALKTAALPVKALSNPVTRAVSSAATGVPAKIYKIAQQAGATDDPALKAAYQSAASGQSSATDFLTKTQGAIKSVKQAMSDDYLAQKGPLAQQPVSFTNTNQALADATAKAGLGSTVGRVPQETMDAINAAKAMVDNVASDPARNTIENVDALKQQLWDLKDLHPNLAGNYLNNIYHGVRSDLVAADPKYAELMEKYQTAMSNVKNITSTLVGNGKAPAAGAALTKSLRAIKTGNGKDVLDQIAQYDPTIPYMIAGHAVNQLGSGMSHAVIDAAVAGAPAALLHPLGAVAALPAAALGIAASSPKINAALHYGAGTVGELADKAARPADAVYAAGRVGQEGVTPSDNSTPETGPIDPSDPDAVYNKMLHIESGNRQRDASGKVIISPAGAIGAGQIMPGTGPLAAKLAGVPWSLSRLSNDEAYNRQLSRALYDSLLKTFNGDTLKAAAAYNSNPAAVNRAIRVAGPTGDWTSHLPTETKNYVANISGNRVGRATGGKTGMSHEQLVERLMKLARAAKKGETKETEPLLKLPDSVVAKALDIAQQAI